MEVKPCNGDAPITDEDGKEYDCGSGPARRDCPSNTYCHQTTSFARCCKKGGSAISLSFSANSKIVWAIADRLLLFQFKASKWSSASTLGTVVVRTERPRPSDRTAPDVRVSATATVWAAYRTRAIPRPDSASASPALAGSSATDACPVTGDFPRSAEVIRDAYVRPE